MSVAGTREALYVICNAYREPLDFALPAPPFQAPAPVRRIVGHHFCPRRQTFTPVAEAPAVTRCILPVEPRTCVLLIAERPKA